MINVHKEKGFTSHDVVAKLRGIVGQKKIGHTGTLDPDATGVLPVCLGKGTKLCDLLTDKDKTYETVMLLGKETTTQDISGEILNEMDIVSLTKEEVLEIIYSFVGLYEQVPPMYSALKVNGKKLYELAREGKVIERKARPVTIHSIKVLEVNLPEVRMEVCCSKGTYIRTLCHDIGLKLKTYACMKELVRTKVSMFSIEDSFTLPQLQELKDNGELHKVIQPIDTVFPDCKKITLPQKLKELALNGNPLPSKEFFLEQSLEAGETILLYLEEQELLGLYEFKKESGLLKLRQFFLDIEEYKNTNKYKP